VTLNGLNAAKPARSRLVPRAFYAVKYANRAGHVIRKCGKPRAVLSRLQNFAGETGSILVNPTRIVHIAFMSLNGD